MSKVVLASPNTLVYTLSRLTPNHFAAKDEHKWQAAIFNMCNSGLTCFTFRKVSSYSAIKTLEPLMSPALWPGMYHFSTGNTRLSWVTDI